MYFFPFRMPCGPGGPAAQLCPAGRARRAHAGDQIRRLRARSGARGPGAGRSRGPTLCRGHGGRRHGPARSWSAPEDRGSAGRVGRRGLAGRGSAGSDPRSGQFCGFGQGFCPLPRGAHAARGGQMRDGHGPPGFYAGRAAPGCGTTAEHPGNRAGDGAFTPFLCGYAGTGGLHARADETLCSHDGHTWGRFSRHGAFPGQFSGHHRLARSPLRRVPAGHRPVRRQSLCGHSLGRQRRGAGPGMGHERERAGHPGAAAGSGPERFVRPPVHSGTAHRRGRGGHWLRHRLCEGAFYPCGSVHQRPSGVAGGPGLHGHDYGRRDRSAPGA